MLRRFSGGRPVTASVAGFKFGGAAGTAANAAAAEDAAADTLITAQIDGDVAQYLRHLSKRDPVTKLKALQALKALIPERSAADLAPALPPWLYVYKKLIMDLSRTVRAEASQVMSLLAVAVGKQIAPHLKSLMGAWWLAQFDPYSEASAAARSGLQAAFPGRKQLEALLFCRAEVVQGLQVSSTARRTLDSSVHAAVHPLNVQCT